MLWVVYFLISFAEIAAQEECHHCLPREQQIQELLSFVLLWQGQVWVLICLDVMLLSGCCSVDSLLLKGFCLSFIELKEIGLKEFEVLDVVLIAIGVVE